MKLALRDGAHAFSAGILWLAAKKTENLKQTAAFLLPSRAKSKEFLKPQRRRQIEALRAAAGAWKDKDHPELKQGSARWTRRMRQQSERRFKKVTAP